MQNVADAVLDYLWFIDFSEDDELDPDQAVELGENLTHRIQNEWTEEEKQALIEAARRRLDWWQQKPDEHGYTPRELLTDDQKAFLEALSSGRFDGWLKLEEDDD